jgi:hypothetical protein
MNNSFWYNSLQQWTIASTMAYTTIAYFMTKDNTLHFCEHAPLEGLTPFITFLDLLDNYFPSLLRSSLLNPAPGSQTDGQLPSSYITPSLLQCWNLVDFIEKKNLPYNSTLKTVIWNHFDPNLPGLQRIHISPGHVTSMFPLPTYPQQVGRGIGM